MGFWKVNLRKGIGSILGRTRSGDHAGVPSRVIMFTSFAGMSAVNYAFGLAAGWLLAPGDFGLLAFTQTILTIGGMVLNSGFAWSLTADVVGAGAVSRAKAVRGAAIANGLLALGISLMVFGLFAAGLLRAGFENWQVAALVIVELPLLSFVAIARAAAQGSEHFGMLAALFLVETGIKAAAGIGFVLAGFGAAGAVAGFLVGSLCANVLGAVYLVRRLGIKPWGAITRPHFGKAGAMFAALLGLALLLNLDTIGLKLFFPGDRAAVGQYQAGIVLANTPYYLLTAMIPIFFTQIARVKQIGRSLPTVAEGLRLAAIVLLPIEAALAAFPATFLRILFPAPYLAGADTLRILALANGAIILVAIFSTAFQASGQALVPGRILLAVTACEAVVLRFVVPAYHGVGAASTFLTATTVALALLGGSYYARLDGRPLRGALTWLSRYALALIVGSAVCAIGLRLSGNDLVAIALGGASYAAAVFALRLISLPSLLGGLPVRSMSAGVEELP